MNARQVSVIDIYPTSHQIGFDTRSFYDGGHARIDRHKENNSKTRTSSLKDPKNKILRALQRNTLKLWLAAQLHNIYIYTTTPYELDVTHEGYRVQSALLFAGGSIVGFLSFSRILAWCEMQIALSKVWTLVATLIFHWGNHYTASAFNAHSLCLSVSLSLSLCIYIYLSIFH